MITNPETFGTDVPGHIHQISLRVKQVLSIGNKTPIGKLDGIEADGKGNYFVSDWVRKNLLYESLCQCRYLIDVKNGECGHQFH
ncbi:MAG: hypothetical protein ACE5FZ_08470 [Nitrospiria bacterium]